MCTPTARIFIGFKKDAPKRVIFFHSHIYEDEKVVAFIRLMCCWNQDHFNIDDLSYIICFIRLPPFQAHLFPS